MKIGLQLGYWGSGPPPNAQELVVEAERLGYDSVWTAESYGSDALTPLSWWGSRTERVRLGPLVARVGLLPDAVLVHTLTSLQRIVGDRLIAALGSGDRLSAAMAMAVGVRADSWHSEVPRRTREVREPHHESGVNASEP